MHPDLENIINLAVEAGPVSDRQREIILNKAKKLGVDEVEAEIYLDSRINQMVHQASEKDARVFDEPTKDSKTKISETLHKIDMETSSFSKRIKSQKLFRSSEGKLFTGLCAGIAKYFNVSTTLVRALFVITVVLVSLLIAAGDLFIAAIVGVLLFAIVYFYWSVHVPMEKK